jgi:hypothetical protein
MCLIIWADKIATLRTSWVDYHEKLLVSQWMGVGLVKRVHGSTRLRPAATRDPFSIDPDTTCLNKRVRAPDTTRPAKIPIPKHQLKIGCPHFLKKNSYSDPLQDFIYTTQPRGLKQQLFNPIFLHIKSRYSEFQPSYS